MIYVIADIHGEYDLLVKLLEKINFSSGDELYVCGDMIDKGKYSVSTLKLLSSMSNVHCILGNHEYAFLKYYWSLLEECNGNYDAVLAELKDYFPFDGELLDWETIGWLESLPYYIEKDNFICVHAGIPITLGGKLEDLSKVEPEEFVCDRHFKDAKTIPITDKCIFFGHTPTSYIVGTPRIIAYKNARRSDRTDVSRYAKIHLDLGVWLHGTLGCYCASDLTAYYVSND